jgi:hypothetical protein
MTIVRFTVMVTSLCHVRAPSRAASDRVPERTIQFSDACPPMACALLANGTSAHPIRSSQPLVCGTPLRAIEAACVDEVISAYQKCVAETVRRFGDS